jgi:FAD/FMN-containing dehydrogenase
VADDQDVIAAIQFARDNKLKVVVRGGGHNWCQPSLRNGGLLIDLKNLDKVISIDEAASKRWYRSLQSEIREC